VFSLVARVSVQLYLFPQLSTRVSSVSIVTRLLVDNPELDFARCLSPPKHPDRPWGPPSVSGAVSPGIKRPEREVGLSSSSADVKNE
jgi:hypothetical protein